MKDGALTMEFKVGIKGFINFSLSHLELMDQSRIRCPCDHRKCQNRNFQEADTVRYHLAKYIFVRDYYTWYLHGEPIKEDTRELDVNFNEVIDVGFVNPQPYNAFDTMLIDVVRPSFNPNDIEEDPNPTLQNYLKC